MAGVVVITGAGRGIGAATALAAARQGYAVGVNFERDAPAAAGVVDRIPLGRVGAPEQVAAAILWLWSDAAAYATGSVLTVAGGH
jgi:NAD(P)-dependent dehydrogenase (short-subunit alcohol dehydrogenase family)